MPETDFIQVDGDVYFFDSYPIFKRVFCEIKQADHEPVAMILNENQARNMGIHLIRAADRLSQPPSINRESRE